MPLTKNPASAKTRITVWSLVSFCLVGTVAGLLALSFQEVQGQVQTLPDGTRVELAGVTYGKRHEHRVGNFWQRWIGGRNGTSVIGTAGSATTISVTLNPIAANHPDPLDTPVDSLVLWQKVSPGAGAHSDLRSAAAIDEHGCRLRCLGEGWQSYPPGGMQTSAGASEVQPLTLLASPRRAAGFQYAPLELARGNIVNVKSGF